VRYPWRDSWNASLPLNLGDVDSVHLDLGCGANPRNPVNARRLVGCDILDPDQIGGNLDFEYVQVTPGLPLPFPDATFDAVSGFDFIEHLPRYVADASGIGRNYFIETLNEISRVLKIGGIFLAVTPCYPSATVFDDPTHVNVITKQSHTYFTGPAPMARTMGYGFTGSFEAVTVQKVYSWSPLWRRRFAEVDARPRFGTDADVVQMWLQHARNPVVLAAHLRAPSHLLWILQRVAY
jgi:SAM-dependent methyltransferase